MSNYFGLLGSLLKIPCSFQGCACLHGLLQDCIICVQHLHMPQCQVDAGRCGRGAEGGWTEMGMGGGGGTGAWVEWGVTLCRFQACLALTCAVSTL